MNKAKVNDEKSYEINGFTCVTSVLSRVQNWLNLINGFVVPHSASRRGLSAAIYEVFWDKGIRIKKMRI